MAVQLHVCAVNVINEFLAIYLIGDLPLNVDNLVATGYFTVQWAKKQR